MEVEAAVETPLVFAGDQVEFSVEFLPPPINSGSGPPPILLSGYAVVQGSFKLGEMLLSEPFADTRKQGIVLTKRGIEYGQSHSSGSLFSGVLDGLKQLVVTTPDDAHSPGGGSGRKSVGSSPSSDNSNTANDRRASRLIGDYDDGDYPIFSTAQLLLFTDLHLKKPEKFHFCVDLPRELPPSYRSRSLYITYNLVVGFERIRLDANSRPIDSKPVDVRLFLPFRLLAKPPTPANPHPPKFDLRRPMNAPPPKLTTDNSSTLNGSGNADNEPGEPMAEFIDSLLDSSSFDARRKRSSSLANLPGAQYTKVSYDISRNKTPIAQLVLAKPTICVGDVLAAQVKLKRPCLHISVYLELEELIEEPYAALAHTPLSNNNNSSTSNNGQTDSTDTDVATAYIIYARQFQGVYGMKEVSLYLPTLTSITPRLDTDQVTAGWSLRIEFVGLTGSAFADDDDHDALLAKGQVDHEVFTCRIPVTILPPSAGGHSVAKTWRF